MSEAIEVDEDDLIPAGLLAWATLKLRPYDIETHIAETPSQSTDSQYLDIELTIEGGDYDKRKVWDTVGVYGSDRYVQTGQAAIRHMLEVGNGAGPQNNAGYCINNYFAIDGLKVAIEIGVEIDSSGNDNRNTVRYLSTDPKSNSSKDYARLVAGDTAPKTAAPAVWSARKMIRRKAARIAKVLKFLHAVSDNAGLSSRVTVATGTGNGTDEIAVDSGSVDEASINLSKVNGARAALHQDENLASLFSCDLTLDDKDADKIFTHLSDVGFLTQEIGDEDEDRVRVLVLAVTTKPFREGDGDDPIWHALCELTQFGLSVRTSNQRSDVEIDVLEAIIGEYDPEELASRIALTPDTISSLAEVWNKVGHSVDLFNRMTAPKDERVTFCVEGLIPRGCITVLAGAQEVGKSTLAHELAIAVGGGDKNATWLGQSVCQGGLVVYLAGEDTNAVISERANSLDPDQRAANSVLSYPSDGRLLQDILSDLRNVPDLALIVVDPAIKYIDGDEDSSNNVDRFFAALQDIAVEKNCAVVVVHHLGKNAKPQNLSSVLQSIRGSGVITNRPRVVLCMFRRGDRTTVGIGKCNLPPSCKMVEGARTFFRDKDTLRHVSVDEVDATPSVQRGGAETADQDETNSLKEKVLDAYRALKTDGKRVSRTGKYELYEWHVKELAGNTRASLRKEADGLVDEGVFIVENGQLFLAQ